MDRAFYVYAYLIDGVICYVGKGSGPRISAHIAIAKRIMKERESGLKVKATHFHNRLGKALAAGRLVESIFLRTNLSEQEAFDIERDEIAARWGQLLNQTSGGSTGSVVTDEIRAKLSQWATKRYADPVQRLLASAIAKSFNARPEVKAKLSESQRKNFANGTAASKAFHASSHTQEVYRKRGATLKKTLKARPDLVAGKAKRSKEWWSDSENNRIQRSKLTSAWARPETIAKHRAYLDSPEGRANLKAASDKRWANHRARKTAVAS